MLRFFDRAINSCRRSCCPTRRVVPEITSIPDDIDNDSKEIATLLKQWELVRFHIITYNKAAPDTPTLLTGFEDEDRAESTQTIQERKQATWNLINDFEEKLNQLDSDRKQIIFNQIETDFPNNQYAIKKAAIRADIEEINNAPSSVGASAASLYLS